MFTFVTSSPPSNLLEIDCTLRLVLETVLSGHSNLDMEDSNGLNDPAAEFLAREQENLAGLEDDLQELNMDSNSIKTEDSPIKTNGASDDGYTSSHDFTHHPESEKIRIWREEQAKMLKIKDEEEQVKKEELRRQAKKELEEWYSRYREQLEKTKKNNRVAEKEWVQERDQDETGLDWEKVKKLCDFNSKSVKHVKDTSRLRSILLQTKSDK